MSNTPAKFRAEGGRVYRGVAGGTVNENKALTYNSSGLLVHADNVTIGVVGVARSGYSTNGTMSYHKGGRTTVVTTGTVAAGDYLKVSATAGVLATDGTSGSTAKSNLSVAIAVEAADADNITLVEWLAQ